MSGVGAKPRSAGCTPEGACVAIGGGAEAELEGVGVEDDEVVKLVHDGRADPVPEPEPEPEPEAEEDGPAGPEREEGKESSKRGWSMGDTTAR